MKKTIIGFVLAGLVVLVGSCELQKGGTIKITNTSDKLAVSVYVYKNMIIDLDDLVEPPNGYVAKKENIAINGSGEISIGEDGTYYIYPFFLLKATVGDTTIIDKKLIGTCEPEASFIAILALGNSVPVKVKPPIGN